MSGRGRPKITSSSVKSNSSRSSVSSPGLSSISEANSNADGSTSTSTSTIRGANQDYTDDTLQSLGPVKLPRPLASLKSPNTLLSVICDDPDDIEDTVRELFENYKGDKNKFFSTILQLFIDLANSMGQQLDNPYKMNRENQMRTIDRIVADLEKLWKENDTEKNLMNYFFKSQWRGVNSLAANLSKFFEWFFNFAYNSRVFFDVDFQCYLMGFLQAMSNSKEGALCNTALVLISKSITALIKCLKTVKPIQAEEVKITEMIQGLFKMVDEICEYFFHENAVSFAKTLILTDMHHWIESLPAVFNNVQMINILEEFMLDRSVNVKLRVARVCGKLLRSNVLGPSVLKPLLNTFSDLVEDENIHVAQTALEIFVSAFHNIPTAMATELRDNLIPQIYCKDMKRALMAGKFFGAYLQYKEGGDAERILITCALIPFLEPEHAERSELFVEICYEFIPALSMIEVAFGLIDKWDDENVRNNIIYLMYESCRFKLLGQFSSKSLSGAEVQEILPQTHQEIAHILLPRVKNLLRYFHDNKLVLERLLEIFKWFDIKHFTTEEDLQLWKDAFQQFKILFGTAQALPVMENLCHIFHNISDNDVVDKDDMDSLLTYYLNFVKEELPKYLCDELTDEEELSELRLNIERVASLFAHFDLTDMLNWDELTQNIILEHLTVAKHLVQCKQWSIIWNVRKATDVQQWGLSNLCQEYVNFCNDLLPRNNVNVASKITIFNSLKDYLILFEKEMKTSKTEYFEAVANSFDNSSQEIGLRFVLHHVFYESDATSQQKQDVLKGFFLLIHHGFIQLTPACKILQFYESHYDEHGETLDAFVANISKKKHWECVILKQFLELFANLPIVLNSIDRTSDGFLALKRLTEKFGSCTRLRSSQCEVMVTYATNWAISEENDSSFTFLEFMKPFVAKLKTTKKKILKGELSRLFSAEAKKDPSVDLFLSSF